MMTLFDRTFADPFAMMNDVRRQFDAFFGVDPFRGFTRRPQVLSATAMSRAAFEERENELVLRAEVPGLTREDLNIAIEGQTLTLSGQRKVDPPEGYRALRQERTTLRFRRAWELPIRIDATQATATIVDGILELHLPKHEDEKPRRIEIQAK